MASLVCVIAVTHNPRIFWNSEGADAASRAAVHGMFEELRRRLAEARPDRLIVVGNDHFDNFFLDTMPAFCVGLAPVAEGPFWYEAEVMRTPSYRAAVDVGLADDLINLGMRRGIDFAQSHEFRLDHGFCIPLWIVRPEGDLPIAPVFTNTFAYPLPTPRRFFELGQTIQALVRERPASERVAVVTSSNLSLDVGGPKVGRRDEEFNRLALDLMRRGRVGDILSQLSVERLLEAGCATAEFLNYDAILGVVEDRPPDFFQFHRVPAWGDCPGVAWSLG